LGPFYNSKPYYIQVQELIEKELEPLYDYTFQESYKLLKNRGNRLVLVAPVFTTLDGGDLQINIEKIARKNNFNLIPMIDTNRIINKSNQKLQFNEKHVKSLLDAKKGQILKRKIYVFEKK